MWDCRDCKDPFTTISRSDRSPTNVGTKHIASCYQFRQVEIVNIIKEIFPTTTKSMSSYVMKSGNTALHLVGESAPPFKLRSVSGAALQMQRELQWFKVWIMSD